LEKKAYAQQSDELLGYLKRHARFFLLLTMVLGGITGVGIWFTIALLNPAATSSLIHTFVFAWATEWVCFVGEIIALFIYYYTFGKMRPVQKTLAVALLIVGLVFMGGFEFLREGGRRPFVIYIVTDLQTRAKPPEPAPPTRISHEVPPFDPAKDDYVLLAWNNLGMTASRTAIPIGCCYRRPMTCLPS